MLFVLSPATLLFPLLDPEAFGRKDALILTVFALSLLAARAFGRGAALVATALAYAVANLVVDSAIFYAPMAAFAGCWIAPARPGSGTVLIARVVPSARATRPRAVSPPMPPVAPSTTCRSPTSSSSRVPGAPATRTRSKLIRRSNTSACRCGTGSTSSSRTCRSTRPSCTTCSACRGLLALVPLAALAWRVRWNAVGAWERACGLQAVACGFLPFVFAADWGRYIHLLAMQGFVLMNCPADGAPRRRGARRPCRRVGTAPRPRGGDPRLRDPVGG